MRSFLAVLMMTGMAHAADWERLTSDDEVLAALEGQTVLYESARQKFSRDGITLYDAGRPTWGNWRARAGQYCSEWPPAEGWDCYDLYLSTDGAKVRFRSPAGELIEGRYD